MPYEVANMRIKKRPEEYLEPEVAVNWAVCFFPIIGWSNLGLRKFSNLKINLKKLQNRQSRKRIRCFFRI